MHDRRRLVSSVAGVAFAVVLMLTELGFFYAIEDGSTLLVDALAADLLLVNPLKDDMNPSKPLPRARLAQARAVAGVDSVSPVWISRLAAWSTSGQAKRDVVRLVGFDPDDQVFLLPEIRSQQHLLEHPDTALVDRKLRDSYGGLVAGATGELEGRRVDVVGDFSLGPDLQLNVNLLVSDQTFRRTLLQPSYADSNARRAVDPLDRVELGAVRIAAGADLDDVARRLADRLPDDVAVRTPEQFRDKVHRFWTRNQPVGAVFGLGFVVGFFIGLAICYQVLYTDVVDQLPQFATLKAMGYRGGFLLGLAVRRGCILAVFALLVGVPTSRLVYGVLGWLTALPFSLTLARISTVAAATIVMCVVASVLATRRAILSDPADVF
ncbi:MAG: ABC transporter permease [Thermoanaerobaculia bacterium]|nr:ABC transporter permease [Thermoanaerobaculia bacterium]